MSSGASPFSWFLSVSVALLVLALVLIVAAQGRQIRNAERWAGQVEGTNRGLSLQLEALRPRPVQIRMVKRSDPDRDKKLGPDWPAPTVQLPAHISKYRPVWIGDNRPGITFHDLDDLAEATRCNVPVRIPAGGGFGQVVTAETAVATFGGRACGACFPVPADAEREV